MSDRWGTQPPRLLHILHPWVLVIKFKWITFNVNALSELVWEVPLYGNVVPGQGDFNKLLFLWVQMKKIARRQQQQQQQQQEQEQMGGTRRGPSRGGRQSNDDSEGKTRTQLCEMAWWKVWTRLCLSTDGSSSHGLDGLLTYSSLQRQQLLALDPNIYGSEQFRHGLMPPQLGTEQMHSYGKDELQHWLFFSYCLYLNTDFISDSETVFHDLDSDGSLSHLGDCLLSTAEGGVLAGRIGNPIDRLYSMQNSYFTSWPWFHLPKALLLHCRGQQVDWVSLEASLIVKTNWILQSYLSRANNALTNQTKTGSHPKNSIWHGPNGNSLEKHVLYHTNALFVSRWIAQT